MSILLTDSIDRAVYPLHARVFIAGTVLLGLAGLAAGTTPYQSSDPVRFLSYLLLAILSSGLRIGLPTMTGTLSINFLFIQIGLVELTVSETLVMGGLMTLMQCMLARERKPTIIKTLFNISVVTLAIIASAVIYYYEPIRQLGVAFPVLLVLSSLILFFMITIPVSLAIAWTENRSALGTWRECNLWSLPYYLAGAAVAGAFTAITRNIGWQLAMLLIPVAYLMTRSYQLYVARVDDSLRHAEEMADLHLRTIEALALAIEAKDSTTADHLQRVQTYAIEIAKEMGLSVQELEALRAAALLHDIGKLAVPEHILSKPGRLTPDEFEKMKIHPIVGAEIIERANFPYAVAPIVRSHHERWNGEGYPDGLHGEDIPIGARILSAVDCLDALSTDRQYRRGLPLLEALDFVKNEAGKAFDPAVVEILARRCVDLEQQVRNCKNPIKELSTNVKVVRGAPAAGFAEATDSIPAKKNTPQEPMTPNFLDSIAAARLEVLTLFELTNDLGSSLSLQETLSVLATRLKRLVPFDSLAIYFLRDGKLIPEYVTGENFRLFSSLEIPYGHGLSGWVAERRQPILNGNPSVEPGYMNDPSKFSTLRSALAVPLEGTQRVVGVLALYHNDKDAFSRDHLRILNAISAKLSNSIENALKFRMAETTATTDYLTSLPNARSLFQRLDEELNRCRRSEIPLELLVCDLNGFKQVNDRFGHLEGNRVLREVANRIRENCREYDYVARIGGDEFVILMPGVPPGNVQARAAQLSQLASEAGWAITGERILSCAVGQARFPEDGNDAEQLIAIADKRMYRHKFEEREKRQASVRPGTLSHVEHAVQGTVNYAKRGRS